MTRLSRVAGREKGLNPLKCSLPLAAAFIPQVCFTAKAATMGRKVGAQRVFLFVI